MTRPALPPQSSINPRADAYGERCLALHDETMAQVETGAIRLHADLSYGPNYWQKIDIWTQIEGEALPVLVYFHGGGYTHGYKEWCSFMAPAITGFPAILVSVGYRLAPDVPYPAILDDAFSALRLVVETIAEYGGDPERIYIGGHSAGGQIVMEMALRHERRQKAGLKDNAFRAVFPMSVRCARRLGDLETHAEWKVAPEVPDSPLELAQAGARHPFLVSWGGEEPPSIRDTSPQFHDTILAKGGVSTTLVAPGLDHFDVHLHTRDPQDPWTRRVREWMYAPDNP